MPHNHTVQPHVAAAQVENTDLRARIRAFADEVAEDAGFFVVDVQVRGQKGSRIIEVFVDGDDGIGTDDLAAVSRSLGFLLEVEEVVKGKYNLNVSSPGADRPLLLPRQYRKHTGRLLRVQTADQAERTGTLTTVYDDRFDLDLDGTTESIAFADVTEARVQLPW